MTNLGEIFKLTYRSRHGLETGSYPPAMLALKATERHFPTGYRAMLVRGLEELG